MGQFYKGTEATFLDDAMFKLPYEQMQAALKAKDTAIGDTIQTAIKLGDFDIAHHAIDREDAARLKQEWETKTQNLVDQVLVDPMNYKKVQGDIMSMSRDLNKDMQFGDISTLGKRKAQIEDYQKSIEELYKKDPEKYAHQSALFANELANTKKYKDPETGEYNYFSGQDLYAAPPLTGVIADIFKDATGKEFESLRVDENGQWKVTRGGKEEGWPADRIENLIIGHMNANPLLMKGYNQAIGLGALPQDALKTAIEAAKERYKRVTTSYTRKDEAGDVKKLEWADAFNKKKENEEQVIINAENVQTNLVNTYTTFKTQVGGIRTDLDTKKESLIAIWNKANPKEKITSAKDLTVGAVIEKLNKLEALNPELYKFSAEKAALKDAALRNQIATSSQNNYKAYLKQKGWKDTKEAFREWHASFSDAKPGTEAYKIKTAVDVTFQGTGLGKKEIEGIQGTANANRFIMPFQIGKDFNLPTKVVMGGKEQDVILNFPVGDQDPMYRELKRTYDNLNAKLRAEGKKPTWQIKPGVNYITKDGKVYGIDTRLMNTGGTATWEKLVDLGHVKVDAKPTVVATTTETGALDLNAAPAGQEVPSYIMTGSGKVINFEPTTFAPAQAVNSSNNTYYQGTWRVGNHSTALKYETNAPNVPTNTTLNNYLQKSASSYKGNKYVTQFGGTGNLDGNVDLGNGEKMTLKNGVLYHKPSNRQGEITIRPDNEQYQELMGTYMEYKMLQSK